MVYVFEKDKSVVRGKNLKGTENGVSFKANYIGTPASKKYALEKTCQRQRALLRSLRGFLKTEYKNSWRTSSALGGIK